MCGNRDVVIEKFANAFLEKYNSDEHFRDEVDDLRDMILDSSGVVTLGCWCKPKSCHGDFLKDFLLGPDIDEDEIEVVNVRNVDEVDVYIGRGRDKSHMNNTDPGERGWLGNPFEL